MSTKIQRESDNVIFLKCSGGNSYRSNHGPYKLPYEKHDKYLAGGQSDHYHDRGIPYHCRTCKTYMGCSKCAQMPSELVCLRCGDWAMEEGEKEHGRMMKDREAGAEALRIVRMVAEGKLSVQEGLDLVAGVIPGSARSLPA